MAKKVGWQLDLMPEKMMALAKFHGSLLANISSGPASERIKNTGAGIISKYFEAYVDAVAKIDPYRYHHIYEFNMVGSKGGRLFKGSVKNSQISYTLVESRVPNNNGQVFSRKAFVMESGQPLEILPKNGKFLVYEVDGETVFSKGSYVSQPGGPYVANAFREIFQQYFNSRMPNAALRDSGFYDTIEQGLVNETIKVSSAISAGAVRQHAQQAAQAAYGIAGKVESNGNRL